MSQTLEASATVVWTGLAVINIDSTTVGRPSGPITVCVIQLAMLDAVGSATPELIAGPLIFDTTAVVLDGIFLPAGTIVNVTVWVERMVLLVVRETVEYSRK